MGRTYLWTVVVCLIVISPFADMAGAGDMANPVTVKDLGEYGIDDELFYEPVFTVNGQAVTEQKQEKRSNTPNRTQAVPDRQIQEAYGKLPLYFIQNNGQMDERVKFYEKGIGHAMFFTEDGIYLSLTNGQEARSQKPDASCQMPVAGSQMSEDRNPQSEIQNLSPSVLVGDSQSAIANQHLQSAIVRLVPLGANKHPKIVAEGLQQGKVNYFIGNNPEAWRINIPTYSAVIYKEIYDGIDIKFYGNNRQLEYDVIVRPGADPSQVRFAYEGIEDLRVNEDGDLEIILSRLGEDKTDGFASPIRQAQGRLNPSYTLRSMPEWLSSPLIPLQRGTNTCPPLADAPDCPPLAGVQGVEGTEEKIIQRRPYVYQEIDGEKVEIEGEFRVLGLKPGVGKPDARNTKLTMVRPQSAIHDQKSATRNLSPKVLVGDPQSAICNLQSAIGSPQSETSNLQFIYCFHVAPYDKSFPLIIDPTLEYSTYLGGSSGDYGIGIAVDGTGSVYITGNTGSTNFPIVGTTTPHSGGASNEAFVTKLGILGASIEYSTYLGGTDGDYGKGIAVDNAGFAYIVGETFSSNFPKVGTTTAHGGGGNTDVFVTKLGTSGDSIEYSTYLGSSATDYGRGIAVDGTGCAYITGISYGSGFPVVGTTTTFGGLVDAFVTRLGTRTADVEILYSTYLGGSGNDYGRGIAVDSMGCAYVTGNTDGGFPIVGTTTSPRGGADAFVTKLGTRTTDVEILYSTYLGGGGGDYGQGIAVDGEGCAHVAGIAGSGFPIIGTTTAHSGSNDAFVTKFGTRTTDIEILYSVCIGGSGNDSGQGIAVDDSGSAYVTGQAASGFPIVGTTTAHAGGTYDAFAAKLGTRTTDVEILYSTYMGGSANDAGRGIAVDNAGSAYVTGEATSGFPIVGTTTTHAGGTYDAFVAKLIITPWVVTGFATDITASSATLHGTVSAKGLPTTAMFSYGVTSGSYTGTSSTQSVTGENTAVSISVSGLSASTTYYYRIAANNSAGTSTGSEESFTTSSSGGGGGSEPVKEELTISSTSPSNGATGVSVITAVSATFNMYVNGATVTTETFKLSEENGDVSGSVVTNGKTITFTPSLALSYGTKYTATVTTKVQAANWAGTTMESNYSWDFTTESLIAVTPTPAVSPSPTPAVTVTPAVTPMATVTPVPSPTSTATSTPVPTLPPRPSPTITAIPTLPPPPTLPPVPTPVVSLAPTPAGTATPGECTAESMSLSSYNLRLKMKKSKEVLVTVTSDNGCPVEGDIVTAKVNTSAKKVISISPKRATTNANGEARFKIRGRKAKGTATASFTCEEIEETMTVKVGK